MPEGIEKNPAPCRTTRRTRIQINLIMLLCASMPLRYVWYSRTGYRTIPDLGLVIVDGIRDFLYDINSPSEATDIISRFMQWTDDRQIHIHTILHQNKNDENARGHIGTELNNKAETVMQVEVDKMDRTVSVVEAIHIRDRALNRLLSV